MLNKDLVLLNKFFELEHMASRWDHQDFFRGLMLRMCCLYVVDHDVWNELKKRDIKGNMVERVKGVAIRCDDCFEGGWFRLIREDDMEYEYELTMDKVRKMIDYVDEQMGEGEDKVAAFDKMVRKLYVDNARMEVETPEGISEVMARIVDRVYNKERLGGENAREIRMYDPACGLGGMLWRICETMRIDAERVICGEEINSEISELAIVAYRAHRIKGEFRIHEGDSLRNDWLRGDERFDVVVSHPPFTMRWDRDSVGEDDVRFEGYPSLRKASSDWAFVLHGLYYLKDGGIQMMVMPLGALNRLGIEMGVRKRLVELNYVDCVIQLPSNLLRNTGIPVCIVILKKSRGTQRDVLMINAASHYIIETRQKVLRNVDIDRIVKCYCDRKEVAGYSRKVGVDEIAQYDYNLVAYRYVSELDESEHRMQKSDLNNVIKNIRHNDERIEKAKTELNGYLRELGLEEL